MGNILFHPEAQDEYDEAIAWYQARSHRAADRFEAEMNRLLGLVQLNPEFFPPYDDEHRFAVLKHFAYTLVYQVQLDRIFVVAVAQSRRRMSYWRGRS